MTEAVAVRSPLSDLHHAAEEAAFGQFGPIELVSTFGEPQAEYAALHARCGLIDQPYRGVLEMAGKDRHEFLGNLVTGKTWDRVARTGMAAGTGAYGFFLNLKGRVVADLVLLERGERLLIDTDRRLVGMLRTVFDKYLFSEKVTFIDRSLTHTRIGLIGPGAPAVIYDASGTDVAALQNFGSADVTLFGEAVDLWRDDQTPATNLQLLVPNESAAKVWQGLIDAFADEGRESNKRRLRRVGWAAFNTCRIEAGRPMLGIDYEPAAPSTPGKRKDDTPDELAARGILPAETGLFDRAVDVNKGCYLGQEIVARMYARKVVARQIVGFRMVGDALPLAGAPVMNESNDQIGIVTSSTLSPMLSGACIGLALVKKPHFELGASLRIPAEGSVQSAQVVALPFVR